MTNEMIINGLTETLHNHELSIKEAACISATINALECIEEIKKFAFNTDDDFYGEVLCRKLYKYGFIKKENDEWVDK